MRSILRDPLTHFLIAGIILVSVQRGIGGPGVARDDSQLITVNHDALLTFLQYRNQAFDRTSARAEWEAMSSAERRALTDAYIREEVLYREAHKLGVEGGDYVIKKRMIQRLEFVLGSESTETPLSDAEVVTYFETHRDDYLVEPSITFAHVYFDASTHGRAATHALAQATLERLMNEGKSFGDAARYGDRFPYLVNYVERTPDYVASHFGERLAGQVFALEPSKTIWRGPFESAYGLHVVMVVANHRRRWPRLEEIADHVRADAERARSEQGMQNATRALLKNYTVNIHGDLENALGEAPQP